MRANDFITNAFYILPTLQLYNENYPLLPRKWELYVMWGFWELRIWG